MNTNDKIYARTHAEFLNKLLGKSYKNWMKCTYKINNSSVIWLIELSLKQSDYGWINKISNDGKRIDEIFSGDPHEKIFGHKGIPSEKIRYIFSIIKSPHTRTYTFHGVYALDTASRENHRIWNKVSDHYGF